MSCNFFKKPTHVPLIDWPRDIEYADSQLPPDELAEELRKQREAYDLAVAQRKQRYGRFWADE